MVISTLQQLNEEDSESLTGHDLVVLHSWIQKVFFEALTISILSADAFDLLATCTSVETERANALMNGIRLRKSGLRTLNNGRSSRNVGRMKQAQIYSEITKGREYRPRRNIKRFSSTC